MGKQYSEKDINNVLTLYSLLCKGKKDASIQYLDGLSGVCKIEDSSLRKSMLRERIRNLLDTPYDPLST